MSIDCWYDYGCIWLAETLHEKGPSSLVDLKGMASETFQDGEWSDYLQACFEHMVWRKKIVQVGTGGELHDIIDEMRPENLP
jgi:hypothetical protein